MKNTNQDVLFYSEFLLINFRNEAKHTCFVLFEQNKLFSMSGLTITLTCVCCTKRRLNPFSSLCETCSLVIKQCPDSIVSIGLPRYGLCLEQENKIFLVCVNKGNAVGIGRLKDTTSNVVHPLTEADESAINTLCINLSDDTPRSATGASAATTEPEGKGKGKEKPKKPESHVFNLYTPLQLARLQQALAPTPYRLSDEFMAMQQTGDLDSLASSWASIKTF
jgi:hypothetical protein